MNSLLIPPCYFCQSETQNSYCSNCAIQHNLIYVQTYSLFPIMDKIPQQAACSCSITCLLKGCKFQALYMNAFQNQPEYTAIYSHIEPKSYDATFVMNLPGHPLTPNNIMTKLPIYLTFS